MFFLLKGSKKIQMLQWSSSVKISPFRFEFAIVYLHFPEHKQGRRTGLGRDVGTDSCLSKFGSLTLQEHKDCSNKSGAQINNNY